MTFSTPAIPKNVWFTLLAACAVLCVGSFALHQATPVKRDLIATAFLMDIVITFPAVYYFLLIRPLKLKKWSIFLVFSICCAIAYLILPDHQRGYIIQLRKLSIGLEAVVIIYAISRIRQVRKEYRELQNNIPDFAYNFQKSMATVLGNHPAVKFLTTELTILRFGLFCWIKPTPLSHQIKKFTGYRESGYPAIFGVILFACCIELVAFHLFLNHYSHTAAIIVSVLTAYSLIFIIGDFSAILKSPVLIVDNQILLRTGVRWRALIELDNIASIEKVKDSFKPEDGCFKGSPMKNSFNILFTFNEPINVERIYRKTKATNQILMAIDDADGFIALIESR